MFHGREHENGHGKTWHAHAHVYFKEEKGWKRRRLACRGLRNYPHLAAFPPKARFFRSARLPLMLLPLWLSFASSYLLAESDCGEHGCWSHGTCKQGVILFLLDVSAGKGVIHL